MEIKASREIELDKYEKSLEMINRNIKFNRTKKKDYEYKKWVSVESLIKFYQEMWDNGNILSPNEMRDKLKGDE